jgi:hypothetical protein
MYKLSKTNATMFTANQSFLCLIPATKNIATKQRRAKQLAQIATKARYTPNTIRLTNMQAATGSLLPHSIILNMLSFGLTKGIHIFLQFNIIFEIHTMNKLEEFCDEFNTFFQFGLFDPYPSVVDLCYGEEVDDFEGENRMLQIVFTGSCTYFVGIWIGNASDDECLTYPVYIVDTHDPSPSPPHGNFRDYMTKCVQSGVFNHDMADEDDEDDEEAMTEQEFNTTKQECLDFLTQFPTQTVHNKLFCLS